MNRQAPYVVPLGVSAALPHGQYCNSYLAVVWADRYWLIDCADAPIQRLERVGIDPRLVEGVIITHFHPDHVFGLPSYLLGLYLLGPEGGGQISIYALPEVLERVEALVGLFADQGWVHKLDLAFKAVPEEAGALVAETSDCLITSAPGRHSIPSLAVRFETQPEGRTFVYSSDTDICEAVWGLAQGANLVFHEATGEGHGHSDPEAVGAEAARVGVEQLVLMHYPTDRAGEVLAQARKTFPPAQLAQELKRYAF